MPVKYKYKKEHASDIPENVKTLYVERDGFLILDADGAADAEDLREIRENNIEMLKLIGSRNVDEGKTKLAKLAKIDPDEFERIKTELSSYEAGKAPKLEEILATRTEAMKKEHEKKLTEKETSVQTLTSRLSKVLIDDALVTAAASKGVLPSALEDVKLRGRQVFKLEHDEVVAYGIDNKMRYGKDSKPLSIGEWMEELALQAPHLFGANKGGGAGGNSGGGGGYNKSNPFSKKTRNLTEQGRLIQTNPELAERLKQQAASE